MTRLLTLRILFSTAVRSAVVAKSVILSILFLTSFILAFRVVVVAKLVISGILSSIFFILASFLITSFFTTSHSFLNQQGQVLIYQHLIYLL